MDKALKKTLDTLIASPGQGSIWEQIDKLIRKQQRIQLYEILENTDKKEIVRFPIELDKIIPQNGKKEPALLRFHLQKWQGYDEVFWQALGDYIILALHRVKDVEYDSGRGKIKLQYFNKATSKKKKSPEDIKEIIQGLAFLVDTDVLPTDFTRFRRMTERLDTVGEMSKEQAALVGVILKFI
jgi:malonyl CoA-acyl carrier protein transacylase